VQKYIGVKIISAIAAPALVDVGKHKRGEDGYKVVYEDGYESWSPKEVFEEAYHPTDNMNFGLAIEAMRKGHKVQRSGWNGKGMWLILVPGSPNITPVAGTPYSKAGITEPTSINPHIDMFTATGEMQPGWLASQTDMLAGDWQMVE